MRFRDDNRAVTVQIGAILLFATIIIALSLYQATVVPSQNAEVEYKHSQTAQNQLSDVRNAVLRTAGSGNSQPVSVTLGTQYPSRVFLMNPPPATGTLRTGSYEDGTVLVSNVNATNEETRDFVDGSWNASTKYLEYEPDYSEFDNPPSLLYESSVLSNYYPETNDGTVIPLTDQLLVDNETKTVTLVTLNGSLSTTRASTVSVSPEALSAPYQRVQVQPEDASQPVIVSVPTLADANTLAERTDLGSHPGVIAVQNDTSRPNAVNITVDWNETFTLQTARIGVGSGTENPKPHYITVVENRGDRVTVETRDRFNNPEGGVRVEVNATEPDPFVESSKQTDENGRATFTVRDNESATTDLEIDDGNTDYERITVSVDATSGGGGGGGGASGNAGRLVQVGGAFAFDGEGPGDVTGGLNLTVNNTYDSTVTITDVTVEPEEFDTTGLSDKATGEGYGQSELNVEALDSGVSTALDVPLPDDQYTYVSDRGLTLSLEQSREERVYDTGARTFVTEDTDLVGGALDVGAGTRAEIAFAEFYDVLTDPATALNVSNDDFRVAVTYTHNGSSKTDEFVVYAQPPGAAGGGGGGGNPLVYQTGSASTSSPANDNSGVVFTLENSAGQGLDITSITVESTTDSSTEGFTEGNGGDGRYNREAFFNVDGSPDAQDDPADGYVEEGARIDIGQTESLDNIAQLSDGDTTDVYLYQFVNNGGNSQDLSGDDVTVTVGYELADGTTGTYTFTFTA